MAFQDFTAKLNQPALLAGAAVLGLAVFATAVLLYQTLQSANYQPALNPAATKSSANPPSYSIRTITNSYLFGRADSKTVEQLTLPETRKALQLRGAFTATNPKLASAIIEGADQEARHYKVGAQIQDGIKLYSVYGDRVVLSNRGQLETLYFPSHDEIASEPEPSQPELTTQQAAAVAEQAKVEPVNISESVKTEAERNALIRQRLEALRNRIRKQ